MKDVSALVYISGHTPTAKEQKAIDKARLDYSRVSIRNAGRFNFLEQKQEKVDPYTGTKSIIDAVLKTDAEICDVVLTESPIVKRAYEVHKTYEPELRPLFPPVAKKKPAAKPKRVSRSKK